MASHAASTEENLKFRPRGDTSRGIGVFHPGYIPEAFGKLVQSSYLSPNPEKQGWDQGLHFWGPATALEVQPKLKITV